MTRTANTILNKSVKSGYPYLIPDLRENAFSFLLLIMMLALGLSHTTFTMLRYVPSVFTLLRLFIMIGFYILSKFFLNLFR